MIEFAAYKLPEVVDREELRKWRSELPRKVAAYCPKEVKEFINAIAFKLGEFKQYKTEIVSISGFDLLLCGLTKWEGEQVDSWSFYEMTVPKMLAVDHHGAMHRIFARKGKQGLIDYCKVHVRASDLEETLRVLSVEVFHEHKPEFVTMMAEINAAKKIESVL